MSRQSVTGLRPVAISLLMLRLETALCTLLHLRPTVLSALEGGDGITRWSDENPNIVP